jgi:hypothetical protein
LTLNTNLQTKRPTHSVKSVNSLGFYYKLRVGELAREWACPYTVNLHAVEGVPCASLFCDFRGRLVLTIVFCVTYSCIFV